jgi:hypothetical protein
LALIASNLRSTSKKPFCPMTRSLHPPITTCDHRVRFVATWPEEFFEVPEGLAAVVRREFLADFREHNLTAEERVGSRFGSDDAPFSQKGIPTIGLYTGAGGPKSEIQASLFGGAAGRPYDPCYHRACDTIENINRDVLEQNTRALVRALNAAAFAARAPSTPSQKAVDLPEPNL